MTHEGALTVLADSLGLGAAATVEFVSVASRLAGAAIPTAVPEPEPTGDGPALPPRYVALERLGRGGMAEVWRVLDRDLDRTVALKIIDVRLVAHGDSVSRFLEEVRVTAQLAHPAIVPVHDAAALPGGRLYYTMKEVHGDSLASRLSAFHKGEPGAMSFRALVYTLQRVCEAVAYAHARGVVHRDLKPHNVMVGEFGEVLVVDWGLAKVLHTADTPDAVVSSRDDATATLLGHVAGTPQYMPPEQARGDFAELGPEADVYALGAILYQLLGGLPPYLGQAFEVLAAVVEGPPPPVDPHRAPELAHLCERAMARDPGARPSASHVAAGLSGWLTGDRRRDEALACVARAEAAAARSRSLTDRATALEADAAQQLARLDPWAPAEQRHPAWALQDEAATLRRQARQADLEHEGELHAALTRRDDTVEAHAGLTALYRSWLDAAEARGDLDAALAASTRMAHHAALLPPAAREDHVRWLHGMGTLDLVTDPPGAEVHAHVYVQQGRRLVAVPTRVIGTTPLVREPIMPGSHLLRLHLPGRRPVDHPVAIGRLEAWTGIPPGATEPVPVRFLDDLDDDDVYVPPGWCWIGDDHDTTALPRQRVWVDGVVVRRHPVTNAEMISFFDDLLATGHVDDALALVPHDRGTGEPLLVIRDRRFVRAPTAAPWEDAAPALLVHADLATRYASWYADKRGQPWRLPTELEWEHAARGADGRRYPWGDEFDPSFCCMGTSLPIPRLALPHEFPIDESPYGVRHMAGNLREWTSDVYDTDATARGHAPPTTPAPRVDGGTYVLRGGTYGSAFGHSVAAAHRAHAPRRPMLWMVGVRLFRSAGAPARAKTRRTADG